MKAIFFTLGLAILMSGCSKNHDSDNNAHWGYSGQEGPEYWGSLSSQYSPCSDGVNQSPVNLTNFIDSELAALEMVYGTNANEVINNGHTIQVNYETGSTLSTNGLDYELIQFHFHSPSENHINGKSYPLEAHLVHAGSEGNLAVVAVMFEEGDENETLGKIWDVMPENAGGKNSMSAKVSVEGILPTNRDYYRFNGSLTTPPCSEGVLWLVMKQSLTVSSEQVELFSNTMHHPNNRPVQPINARTILE